MHKFDILTFIGRFQPFHNGHKAVVDEALTRAKKVVLVIGSAGDAPDVRNPFTFEQRQEMIQKVYPKECEDGRIVFVGQENHRYNDERWVADIFKAVTTISHERYTPDPITIGVIGHSKDNSSYYLKLFPTWGSVEVPNKSGIDATAIRNEFLRKGHVNSYIKERVPAEVYAWLDSFSESTKMDHLKREWAFVTNYRSDWKTVAEGGVLKYPAVFVTVDAVVVQSGHILLIQRGAMPGEGLLALPGGFVDKDERLQDAAVRELLEETNIELTARTLRGCIRGSRTFDDPNRSLRGRFFTTAFLFNLEPNIKLPKVKGGDDAAKAMWVPLTSIRRDKMFEDHFDIIQTMTGI